MDKLCLAEILDREDLEYDEYNAIEGCYCANCNAIRKEEEDKIKEVTSEIEYKHRIMSSSNQMYDLIKQFAEMKKMDVLRVSYLMNQCNNLVQRIEKGRK